MSRLTSGALQPDAYDKHGPGWQRETVTKATAKQIESGTYFLKRAKRMTTEIINADDLTKSAITNLGASLDSLLSLEENITAKTKRITGKIKDSSEKLSGGLLKIEKQANFDKLEKYVELLERADNAIASLAKLEASGQLEKIASAIR